MCVDVCSVVWGVVRVCVALLAWMAWYLQASRTLCSINFAALKKSAQGGGESGISDRVDSIIACSAALGDS